MSLWYWVHTGFGCEPGLHFVGNFVAYLFKKWLEITPYTFVAQFIRTVPQMGWGVGVLGASIHNSFQDYLNLLH
jgi:hypothetical protein